MKNVLDLNLNMYSFRIDDTFFQRSVFAVLGEMHIMAKRASHIYLAGVTSLMPRRIATNSSSVSAPVARENAEAEPFM